MFLHCLWLTSVQRVRVGLRLKSQKLDITVACPSNTLDIVVDQVEYDKVVKLPGLDIAFDVGNLVIVVSVKFIENSSSSLPKQHIHVQQLE